MLAKAKNGHTNIWYILLMNFIATYNIRSPTQDSEKEIVLCKKGDDITRFDGSHICPSAPFYLKFYEQYDMSYLGVRMPLFMTACMALSPLL